MRKRTQQLQNVRVEENRKGEEKDFGCKHGKADLIPCTNAETMTRLTCEYIYASEDARNGYIGAIKELQ
jgi:hypothetical protein